jgi:hypothetical protein
MLYKFKDIEFFKVIVHPCTIWYKKDVQELRVLTIFFRASEIAYVKPKVTHKKAE